MTRTFLFWLATAGSALALTQEAGPITPEEFTRLHAELMKREKWETIPWRVNVFEARAAAVREKKPLFIWAMDGQTLGCT